MRTYLVMGKSKADPSFLILAGARLTVTFSRGMWSRTNSLNESCVRGIFQRIR